MPNQQDSVEPGQLFGNGRYQAERKLGQGGMGMVWLAMDLHLSEEVALKFLPAEIQFDPSALDDMRRETARSRKLSHPNIVRIHDLHEFPGEPPFISMEFIDGVTLSRLKSEQTERCLAWDSLRRLTEQLCAALDYAHGEQVIHRDLKPSNLMLDNSGRLKLADFGIAAVASDSISRVSLQGNTSGTPAYMSPQQMDGRTPRITDDIYALGALLYELLSSKPPFFRGDIPHQTRNLTPDAIADRMAEFGIANTVPGAVGAMIMACLAKDPELRPQSAQVIRDWIALGNEEISNATTLRDQVFEPADNAVSLIPEQDNDLTALVNPTAEELPPRPEQPTGRPGEPRLTEGVELPYEAEDEPAPRSRKRVFALIGTLVLLVALIAFGINRAKQRGRNARSGRTGAGANLNAENRVSSAAWMDPEPTLFRVAKGFGGMRRVFSLNSLDNCTVVVIEEVDGQISQVAEPWSADNDHWSISDGLIRGNIAGIEGGARKSYLVVNGLKLRDFMIGFVFRDASVAVPESSSFGFFYRCRELGDWSFNAPAMGLGDGSAKLLGIPSAQYEYEELNAREQFRDPMREFQRRVGATSLSDAGGEACLLRVDGNDLVHGLVHQVAHRYTLTQPNAVSENGTFALEIWVRGSGTRTAEFSGFLVREDFGSPRAKQ
ncbi:MAG: serine/threonine protein kinase [Limisphaerales bacterium]|jgi:serine/threonine protein kinase